MELVDVVDSNPPLATAYRFESGHRHHQAPGFSEYGALTGVAQLVARACFGSRMPQVRISLGQMKHHKRRFERCFLEQINFGEQHEATHWMKTIAAHMVALSARSRSRSAKQWRRADYAAGTLRMIRWAQYPKGDVFACAYREHYGGGQADGRADPDVPSDRSRAWTSRH